MLLISHAYSQHNPRLTVVRIVIGACLGVLLLALLQVQVLQARRYGTREEIQSLRRIRTPSVRGEIVDRHGVVLADNRPSYDIVIYLEQLQQTAKGRDIGRAAARDLDSLSRTLNLPVALAANVVSNHYARRRPIPLTVWHDVNRATMAAYEERGSHLADTDLIVTPVRQYPHGTLAAHVIGYVGKADPGSDDELEHYYYYEPDSVGRQGVERAYDEWLRGAPGGRTIRVSPTGALAGEIGQKPGERGSRLTLTLDAHLQKLVEDALQQAPLPSGKSLRGAAVVMDIQTGEILAMASVPTFDPNLFNPGQPDAEIRAVLDDPNHPLINRVYGGLYAPGSTFKPVTLLAGLTSGKITPQDRVTCEGALRIGTDQRPFGCWNRTGHGTLDALGAIKQSCDVWFYVKGMATGVEQIDRMARDLGLGEATGLDVGSEREGLVPDPDWKRRVRNDRWRDGDTAHLAIGQSFLQVTPIQMTVAVAALGNGGQVLRPFVVKRTIDAAGHLVQEIQPFVRRRLSVDPVHLAFVRQAMLVAVQDVDGTAHRAAVNGLSIAGKTGTAEFDTPQGRIKRVWFIGFAPFESPQVAVTVMFEDADSGGHTAAPVAGRIMAGIFKKQTIAVGARDNYAD